MNKRGIIDKIVYLNDDLTQCRKQHSNTYGYGVCEDMRFTLPLFMNIKTFVRHGYSTEDVKRTLRYFSAGILWQFCILLGIHPSPSSVKTNFSGTHMLVHGSKAIAIRKIENQISPYLDPCGKSVLDNKYIQHVPPLPIHDESAQTIQEMIHFLDDRVANNKRDIFKWKDIRIKPIEYYEEYMRLVVYCVRVTEKQTFDNSLRENKSICTQPVSYTHLTLPTN